MDGNLNRTGHILRLVGLFGIAVGMAWVCQAVGFGHAAIAARFTWIVAAGSISGAGAGLLLAAASLTAARDDRDGRLNV